MEFRNAPLHRIHAESILREKQINLSYIIKKMQTETWIVAPSRQTRIWDGISVPDIQTYNQSYLRNYKSSFSKYQKALNHSILNRTTWSNAKAFKSNLREGDRCDKCGKSETIEHIFLYCEGQEAFGRKLETYCNTEKVNLELSISRRITLST